jgi:hypothetical protein
MVSSRSSLSSSFRLLLLPLFLSLALSLPTRTTALQLTVFPNAGFAGPPSYNVSLTQITHEALQAYLPSQPFAVFSARIEGTIQPPSADSPHVIACDVTGGLGVFAWVDDHLVCAQGYPIFNGFLSDATVLPLNLSSWARPSALHGSSVKTLRVEMVGGPAESGAAYNDTQAASVELRWAPQLPALPSPSSLGCFLDNSTRDLPHQGPQSNINSPAVCANACRGFAFFGLQTAEQCWCGNAFGLYGKVDGALCNNTCPGNATASCGSPWHNR